MRRAPRAAAEIKLLKAGGASGRDIVTALVRASGTFAGKTGFSQEKYLIKKAMKHVRRARVEPVSGREIARVMTDRHQAGCHGARVLPPPRWDTLAMMLCCANVRSGARAMVIENARGLVAGAVLDRMGGACVGCACCVCVCVCV